MTDIPRMRLTEALPVSRHAGTKQQKQRVVRRMRPARGRHMQHDAYLVATVIGTSKARRGSTTRGEKDGERAPSPPCDATPPATQMSASEAARRRRHAKQPVWARRLEL